MASIVSRIKSRLARNGLSRIVKYIIFVVVLERCGIRVNNQFILDPTSVCSEPPALGGYKLEVITGMGELSDSDTAFLREYGEEVAFGNRFAIGRTCLIVRAENGEFAGACWYGPSNSEDDRRDGMIDHYFTRYDDRGYGIYPWALRFIAATTTSGETSEFSTLYIECPAFNYSSAEGIRKAGFVPYESSLMLGNRTVFKW